jgi:hypothetical protein
MVFRGGGDGDDPAAAAERPGKVQPAKKQAPEAVQLLEVKRVENGDDGPRTRQDEGCVVDVSDDVVDFCP